MVFIDTSSIQYWLFLMPVFHSSSLNSFTNPLIYQFDGWFRLIHVNYLFFCMLNPKSCWWISLKPPIEPPGAARASPVFGASGSPRRARQQRQGSHLIVCHSFLHCEDLCQATSVQEDVALARTAIGSVLEMMCQWVQNGTEWCRDIPWTKLIFPHKIEKLRLGMCMPRSSNPGQRQCPNLNLATALCFGGQQAR